MSTSLFVIGETKITELTHEERDFIVSLFWQPDIDNTYTIMKEEIGEIRKGLRIRKREK